MLISFSAIMLYFNSVLKRSKNNNNILYNSYVIHLNFYVIRIKPPFLSSKLFCTFIDAI